MLKGGLKVVFHHVYSAALRNIYGVESTTVDQSSS